MTLRFKNIKINNDLGRSTQDGGGEGDGGNEQMAELGGRGEN